MERFPGFRPWKRPSEALRSCVGGGVPEPKNRVGLGTFLALDDVKLHVIALFQSFVAVQLNCRVVDEDIGAVIATDESVALGVVEPLDLAFVLSHRLLPSLPRGVDGERKGWGTLAVCEYDEEWAGKVDPNSHQAVHKVR